MSPLRMGTARGAAAVSPEALMAAAEALGAAVDAGDTELPSTPRRRARAVVEKVDQRTSLVGGRTVVALAGATGSGKSSLFNVLVGADVATVGDLIERLRARGGAYAEALARPEVIKAAVNQEHVPFTHPIKPGDEVALFPPVTGG